MERGTRLGKFEIQQRLGAGGMGEVYLATDTRLGREVALKVLSPDMATDPERLARFESEARTIAGLNHPNIVTLHSVEEEGDTRFLAMELVRGKTVDELITRDGMPLLKVFDIAIPLAEAVDAAHRRGITHRDLKPSNVMIDEEGRLKVLDFGLAKLRRGATEDFDEARMPTEVVTSVGQILGTVAYMSPEQAEGLSVDRRADIFSMGVILYEMVAGRRPFTGETAVSVLSAILRVAPEPIAAVRRGVPRQMQRILDRCLAKDPSRRYQSALDLRNELEALRDEVREQPFDPTRSSELTGPVDVALAGARRRFTPGHLGTAAALIAALVLGGWLGARWSGGDAAVAPVDAPRAYELRSLMGRQGNIAGNPAWSPDGTRIAYSSDASGSMDIWTVPRSGGQPVRLTAAPGDEDFPTWSPDGRSIAYTTASGDAGLFLIDAEGGTPFRRVREARRPRFSPDGASIAYDWGGAAWVIPAASGDPRRITENTTGDPSPAWSADGSALYVWNRAAGDVQRVPVDGAEALALGLVPAGEEVTDIVVSPDGTALLIARGQFGGNSSLWTVPLNAGSGLPAGAPRRLTDPFTDQTGIALSPSGNAVVFGSRTMESHLWSIRLDPTTGLATGEAEQLTAAAPRNYYPALSLDGRTLVWTAHQAGAGMLYSMTLGRPEERKVTREWGSREVGASVAPDGQQVSFSSTVGGSYQIWRLPCLDCVALQVTRTTNPIRDTLTAWSPSSDMIVFYSNRSGNWDLWAIDVAGNPEPRQLTDLPGAELYPAFSPDGSMVVFRSEQDGNGDLWVTSPDGSRLEPFVSDEADSGWGAWSPDGRFFYYSSNRSGAYNIWMRDPTGGAPIPVTRYEGPAAGMPEAPLYTRFAVGRDRLVIPVETRRSELWLLEWADAPADSP